MRCLYRFVFHNRSETLHRSEPKKAGKSSFSLAYPPRESMSGPNYTWFALDHTGPGLVSVRDDAPEGGCNLDFGEGDLLFQRRDGAHVHEGYASVTSGKFPAFSRHFRC